VKSISQQATKQFSQWPLADGAECVAARPTDDSINEVNDGQRCAPIFGCSEREVGADCY
jgi:hypothetical protein